MTDLFMDRGAEISKDGLYRYQLWRRWDKTKPRLIFVMLNPSTADAETDDPTIRVCMGRARRMGFGGIRVVNLFAYRATDPAELTKVKDPVGDENWKWLEMHSGSASFGEMTIAAWGDGGLLTGLRWPRWKEALGHMVHDMGRDLYCLGLTKAGQPKHPLRIPYSTEPAFWVGRDNWAEIVGLRSYS